MTLRNILVVALAVSVGVPLARAPMALAAPDVPSALSTAGVSSAQTALAAYRRYLDAQVGTLTGMTRLLRDEIKAGNLDAAQSAYAPAHRYFQRIKPVADLMGDLGKRMDARADAFALRDADPTFTGFHRIEHGLFAKRSTAGLLDDAQRLDADARELRARIAGLDLTPSILADAAAKLARDIAEKRLDGNEERYSRTDLWDLEANIEAVEQIVVLLPQADQRTAKLLANTNRHVAKIRALLETQTEGCGYRNFDTVSTADKAALRTAAVALADELSGLRGTLAMQ